MTRQEWFKLVGRRWYVYFAGILIVIVSVIGLSAAPSVYTATAELHFDSPVRLPPALEGTDQRETLTFFASAVTSKYDAGFPNVRLSSPNATLFGNGFREGVAVELAATGSQWAISNDRPVVMINVASPRSEDVLPTIRRVAGELESISRGLQRDAGAAETYQIRSSMDLDLVTISSFGQTKAGRVGGSVVLFSTSMILSTLVAQFLDEAKRWRAAIAPKAAAGESIKLHGSTTALG